MPHRTLYLSLTAAIVLVVAIAVQSQMADSGKELSMSPTVGGNPDNRLSYSFCHADVPPDQE